MGLRASVLMVLLCSVAMPAWAMHPSLEPGRTAFQNGEFNIALAQLKEAESNPELTNEDRALLLWTRGICLLALKKNGQAVQAFDALLEVEPLYEPSRVDASPRFFAVFKKRADLYRAAHEVTLGPAELQGANLRVPILKNRNEARTVVVFARAPGEAEFRQFPLAVENEVASGVLGSLEMWELAAPHGKLEVVLEARNGRNAAVARVGNALAPTMLPLRPEDLSGALEQLRPPPPVLPPPVVAPPPAEPAPAPQPPEESSRARPVLVGSGSVLLGVGLLGALLGVVAGVTALGSYGAMWSLPRKFDGDRDPVFNTLYMAWLGGMAAAALVFPAVLLAGLLGVAGLVAGALS